MGIVWGDLGSLLCDKKADGFKGMDTANIGLQ